MLKAIHSNLFCSQEQKLLQQARIDKTHHFIVEKIMNRIVKSINSTKNKPQYLRLLNKKVNSSDLTLRVKSLILLHNCLRDSMDNQLVDFVMSLQLMRSCTDKIKSNTTIPELYEYMKENVVNFYLSYLKKITMHKQSYSFVKQKSHSVKKAIENYDKIEIIGHGFQVLNISNYVLTSQEMFNKMGRYHSNFSEIICLYMELLKDMNFYNCYIKKTVQHLSKENVSEETSRIQKQLENISVSLQPVSQDNPSQRETAQVRHLFLYIHESQKLSDKLYEFYHNRYYYKTIRKLMIFPVFLEVPIEQYIFLKNKAKRVDRNLVKMVKISKYDDSTRFHTENNMNYTSFNIKKGKNFNTDYDEIDSLRGSQKIETRAYQNIKADFFDPEKYSDQLKDN